MSIRKSNQKFCTVTSTKDSYQTPKNQILVAKSLNFGRGDKNLVVGESTGGNFSKWEGVSKVLAGGGTPSSPFSRENLCKCQDFNTMNEKKEAWDIRVWVVSM